MRDRVALHGDAGDIVSTPGSRPVRIAEVAELAGVSAMTVSRVVNGSAGVSATSRERVERAVAQLGYRANTAARSLATGRSGGIGVLSVEAPQYGPASTLLGIDAAAQALGASLTFVTARGSDPAGVRTAIARLASTNVDGLIALAPVRPIVEQLRELRPDRPFVLVSGDESTAAATARVDQAAGTRLLVRHLLELGHATVHHVRGPRGWLEADARDRAWRAELRRGGSVVPRPLAGDWTARSGYEVGRQLAEDDDVTAVFAANDQMALGVLRAMAQAGRRVPDDVSVVGFDDTPEAAFYSPPLTTVRQDFGEVGRRCVEMLHDMVRGASTGGHVVIQPELVVRDSTSAPGGVRRRRS